LEHIATEKVQRAKAAATHGKLTAEDVTLLTSARWDSLCAAEQSRISSGMTGEEGQKNERARPDRDTGGGREYDYDRDRSREYKRKQEGGGDRKRGGGGGGGRQKSKREEERKKAKHTAKQERDSQKDDQPPRQTDREGKNETTEAEVQRRVSKLNRRVEGSCPCCRGKNCFERACVMWGRHPHYNKLAFKRGDKRETWETMRKREGLKDEPSQLGDSNGRTYMVTQQELEG